jgi:5-oxopent-3-ene-1,2,5-tricarboxylate decarboxylase / 2-hydroxyhepta-2,4-diene-1,7-dioate isomerase
VLIVAMLHVVADATAGRRCTVARGWLPGGARMLTCKRFFEDAMATSRTVSALLALRGRPQPLEARVEPAENAVIINGRRVDASELDWDTPAIGCLYGVALNFRGLLEALEPEFHRPPHDRPPLAPVLYIKPRNTWLAHRRSVPVPTGVDAVEIGATLAVVIGRDARRVARHRAAEVIAGYTIVNDISLPNAGLFRPPLRAKCRDGFCPVGPWIVPRDAVAAPDALVIRAWVNRELRMENTTANLQRDIATLIADVTEFMTLRAGDLLAVGVPEHPPLARAGDEVTVELEGLGRLESTLVPEEILSGEILP